MKVPVLVATPHNPFGELLRISLEDSGQYQVRVAHSGKEAREAAAQGGFQLAILDSALNDEPFVLLCHDLGKALPNLRLIVIPPENNPNHPALGGLMPHGYLSRPFYLPDLIQIAAHLMEDREKAMHREGVVVDAAARSDNLPPWLQETMALTAYLEKELAGTQALAGIIGLAGTQQKASQTLASSQKLASSFPLRATAGIFNNDAAEELAVVVFRYWDHAENADLMRFIRLAADKRDYLVYATRIIGEMVLILAFDTAAPLSQIRPRTRDMARTLASVPPDGEQSSRPQQPGASLPGEPLAPAATTAVAGANEPKTQPYAFDLDDEGESPVIDLATILGTIPPPDPAPPQPNGASNHNGAHPRNGANAAADMLAHPGDWLLSEETGQDLPSPDPAPAQAAAVPPTAAVPKPNEQADDVPPIVPTVPRIGSAPLFGSEKENLPEEPPAQRGDDTLPMPILKNIHSTHLPGQPLMESQPPPAPLKAPPPAQPRQTGPLSEENLPRPGTRLTLSEPPIDSLEDTRPGAITHRHPLEPLSPALNLLNYTCVLMPRMPQHLLIGELADQLALWVAQTCQAYGWHLQGMAVRPEYLQWSVQVPPSVSPGNLVRILRQRTSQSIFVTFSGIAAQNLTGDFWSPGYLIVSGPQPPSAQLLRDYIAQSRSRMPK